MAAAAPRLTRLATMPRLAQHATSGGGHSGPLAGEWRGGEQRMSRPAAGSLVPSRLIAATVIQHTHLYARIRDKY